MTKTRRAQPVIPAAIALLAIMYVAWQLIGIRFENHDDIYFHLYSKIFAGDFFKFAKDTAYLQARAQAFINMPLFLWINSLQASAWFDAIGILVFVSLYAAIICFLSCLAGRSNALILAAATALLFPLHYYFTFPQGYPVMGPYGLALGMLAATLLASHLKRPDGRKLVASAIMFTISLWGPEYNFILHPIFLLLAWFAAAPDKRVKKLCLLAWPYLLGLLLSVGAYLAFSIMARNTGGDSYGRVSPGFDAAAWMSTFLVLQEKAFLPLGLLKGIKIAGASAQGVPQLPAEFSYATMLGLAGDWRAVAIALLAFLPVSAALLHFQNLNKRTLALTAAVLLAIGTIPAAIVSASAHYQKIVLAGWLHGHLLTFYSHLGLSGLLFLLCAAISNRFQARVRSMVVVALAVVLAAYATLTFIYNNANRQAMMANKQKWQAMELLVSHVRTARPDLLNRTFHAPAFWTATGVSSIPGDDAATGANYWTQYSATVLGQKLLFASDGLAPGQDGVEVAYVATPGGNPVVYIEERAEGGGRRTLLSSQAVAGVLLDSSNGLPLQQIGLSDWTCGSDCTVRLGNQMPLPAPGFRPDYAGPRNVVSQFLMARYAGYGKSLASAKDALPLQVDSWGPQESTAGAIPNLQLDGNAGLWIKLRQPPQPGNWRVSVDGVPANNTNVAADLMTASIDPKVFLTPGKKVVTIYNVADGSASIVGDFVVRAK